MKLTRQPIRDGGTITQGQDTRPALELKTFCHQQAAAFLRARNGFEQRIRGVPAVPTCVFVRIIVPSVNRTAPPEKEQEKVLTIDQCDVE